MKHFSYYGNTFSVFDENELSLTFKVLVMDCMYDSTTVGSLSVVKCLSYSCSQWDSFIVRKPSLSNHCLLQHPRGSLILQVDCKRWESSIRGVHCRHVNQVTTAILQLKRSALVRLLMADTGEGMHICMHIKKMWKKRKSVTNPFPTSVGLSSSQYHKFTIPQPHAQDVAGK